MENSVIEKSMKDKINENVLCILRKNETNQLVLDYVTIENPLECKIKELKALCYNETSELIDIIDFIGTTTELNEINGEYTYCMGDLASTYQTYKGCVSRKKIISDFTDFIDAYVDAKKRGYYIVDDEISKCFTHYKQLQENYKAYIYFSEIVEPHIPDISDLGLESMRQWKKRDIWWRYNLYNKMYAIKRAYKQCELEKNIVAFSHRKGGWESIGHQLSENLSLRIKTNFGFGVDSYFYSVIVYKGVQITPFSDWVLYRSARFAEIVRYSRRYNVSNDEWFDAMSFSKEACNLSLTDEKAFVQKYIVEECEAMCTGLEKILREENFIFRDSIEEYELDKTRDVLPDYRGEKVSGALDFISQISILKQFTEIQSFIDRIEKCNEQIQPILEKEIPIIENKIVSLNQELEKLTLQFNEAQKEYKSYDPKLLDFRIEVVNGKKETPNKYINFDEDAEFLKRYPEFEKIKDLYDKLSDDKIVLQEKIKNQEEVFKKVIEYNQKIVDYFKQEKSN